MSECEYANKPSAYHDGEMPADERPLFEAHLQQCDACRNELGRLRKLSAMLGSLPQPELSAAAIERLHRSDSSLGWLGIRRFAEELTAIAAGILICCTIWMVSQSSVSAAPETISLWQAEAVSQGADNSSGSSEEVMASWVVQDLSARDVTDAKEQHD